MAYVISWIIEKQASVIGYALLHVSPWHSVYYRNKQYFEITLHWHCEIMYKNDRIHLKRKERHQNQEENWMDILSTASLFSMNESVRIKQCDWQTMILFLFQRSNKFYYRLKYTTTSTMRGEKTANNSPQ